MSKKSVFVFNISDINSSPNIKLIMNNYLASENFNYNEKEKCYIVGNPDEKLANRKVVNAIFDINSEVIPSNNFPCLEYQIVEDKLIIKAFILNSFSGMKIYIHSKINSNALSKMFYSSLKKRLFSVLSRNNIILSKTSTEKIKDGSSIKLLKKLLIFLIPTIIILAILIYILYKYYV